MKWIGSRISFIDNNDNISFAIYPPKLGYKKTMIVVWFVLWLLIGSYVTAQFYQEYSKEEKLALFIFMAFWLYFAFRIARTLIYLYYGKELIRLDKESLKIKQATGKFGKTNRYFIVNISKLKMEMPKDNSFKKIYEDSPWIVGSNRIEFEYYGKKYSFGKKLEEKDAEMVFKIITKRLNKFLKNNK